MEAAGGRASDSWSRVPIGGRFQPAQLANGPSLCIDGAAGVMVKLLIVRSEWLMAPQGRYLHFKNSCFFNAHKGPFSDFHVMSQLPSGRTSVWARASRLPPAVPRHPPCQRGALSTSLVPRGCWKEPAQNGKEELLFEPAPGHQDLRKVRGEMT